MLEWLLFLNSHHKVLYGAMPGGKDSFELAFALAGKHSDFRCIKYWPRAALANLSQVGLQYMAGYVAKLASNDECSPQKIPDELLLVHCTLIRFTVPPEVTTNLCQSGNYQGAKRSNPAVVTCFLITNGSSGFNQPSESTTLKASAEWLFCNCRQTVTSTLAFCSAISGGCPPSFTMLRDTSGGWGRTRRRSAKLPISQTASPCAQGRSCRGTMRIGPSLWTRPGP